MLLTKVKKIGLSLLLALVVLGVGQLSVPMTLAATQVHSTTCFGSSCDGKDPYWSGCTTTASAMQTIVVNANETVKMMVSLACEAVYTEYDFPGTKIDLDAAIQMGSTLYQSGFQTFSPTNSPMIGVVDGATYIGAACIAGSRCTPIVYSIGGSGDRTSKAISWAQSQIGSQSLDGQCEVFVENAYGTQYQFKDAQTAFNSISPSTGNYIIGSLVFFVANQGNGFNGHVGMYIGGDTFISATYNGVKQESITHWDNQIAAYEGWRNAPSTWPGR